MGIPGRDAEGLEPLEALAVQAGEMVLTQEQVARIVQLSRRREDQARLAKALRLGNNLLSAGYMKAEGRGPGIRMMMHVNRVNRAQALYACKLAIAEMRGLLDSGEELMTLMQAEIAAGIRDVAGVPLAEFAGVCV